MNDNLGIHKNDPRFKNDKNSFKDKLSKGNLVINDWIKIKNIVSEIYEEIKNDNEGELAKYIPQLAFSRQTKNVPV